MSNVSDRELLELAAKAAGIEVRFHPDNICRNVTGFDPLMNVFAAQMWNPLIDDGDALRLAVKLNLSIRICNGVCVVDDGLSDLECEEVNKVDYAAATRRAIVRAAAEIGKAMK